MARQQVMSRLDPSDTAAGRTRGSQHRDPADLRFELSLTVLGAVCGAVFTAALVAVDASTTGRVVGLLLGSALPPFIEVIGRRRRLRATAGVLVTVASVLLAYGGTNAFAVAIGKPPVLPAVVQVDRPSTPGRSAPPETSAPTEPTPDQPSSTPAAPAPAPEISVAPTRVGCDAAGCDEVIVTSTGTAPLRVTTVEFLGPDTQSLSAVGCAGTAMAADEQCTITITVDPAVRTDLESATLVINQNLPGPPTYVPITARADPPTC